MLATSLSSTAIFCALGGSSVLFSLITFGAAIAAGKAGDEELAVVNALLGVIGLVAAYNCFNNAVSISSAKNTASTTTDVSTENTNGARNSSNPRDYLNDALKQQNLKNPPSHLSKSGLKMVMIMK